MAIQKISLHVGVCLLVVFTSLSAVASTPTEAVRETLQQVIVILEDVELRKAERVGERRERLEHIIAGRFSYEEMAKRTLGQQWNKLNEEQRREFVPLLRRLLINTYAARIETYKGEPIQYLNERLQDGYAEVRTKLFIAKSEILLDYRLVSVAGRWWVYDIVIDGISLVHNYRSQFNRIIRSSSYQALVEALRDKVEHFEPLEHG